MVAVRPFFWHSVILAYGRLGEVGRLFYYVSKIFLCSAKKNFGPKNSLTKDGNFKAQRVHAITILKTKTRLGFSFGFYKVQDEKDAKNISHHEKKDRRTTKSFFHDENYF